jgi:tetratricopeptide (TPR) repeat protein
MGVSGHPPTGDLVDPGTAGGAVGKRANTGRRRPGGLGARGLLLAALLAAAAAAPAAAGPSASPPPAAKRKPPPEGYPAEAITPFVEAVLADKAGNLAVAQRRYLDANRISEQAGTHYNIADVQRRMERWKQAIESYRKYLELAPSAPDRAEVERIIAQIEARPGTAVIDGDEPDALVFVDGKLLGPSPIVLQLPDGRHTADRVTPTGHAHRTFEAKRAATEHVRMSISREEPGNVILNGNVRVTGSWRDQGNEYRLPGRMALPPGRHTTYLVSPRRACSPLVFDAPKPDELVYVYVEAAETERGCVSIKVHQTKVRFPP